MLSKRLKTARTMNKLTQEELAEKVNSTKGTISNYENRHSTPSNEMLVDLADVLGVTTDYLLGKSDKPDGVDERTAFDEEDEEFQKFLNDPENELFFKDMLKSPEEQIKELRTFWKYIKGKEEDRKSGDNQK
jgi:transcriptional regulator with XRE-family HTH domain